MNSFTWAAATVKWVCVFLCVRRIEREKAGESENQWPEKAHSRRLQTPAGFTRGFNVPRPLQVLFSCECLSVCHWLPSAFFTSLTLLLPCVHTQAYIHRWLIRFAFIALLICQHPSALEGGPIKEQHRALLIYKRNELFKGHLRSPAITRLYLRFRFSDLETVWSTDSRLYVFSIFRFFISINKHFHRHFFIFR